MKEGIVEDVLSAREVGVLLRLHRDTVKMIPVADLPFFRANSRGDRRYLRSDVETYIARRQES